MLHFLITECQLDPRACLETPDRKGSDPVYFHALVKGHEGAVIFLLDKGAGPHATDSHEKTALERACAQGLLRTVKYLIIDKEVDTFRPFEDGGGHTPVCATVSSGQIEVMCL